MDTRDSLHSMVDLLSDFAVFEGRTVTIEIVNGSEIKWRYDPPVGIEAVAAKAAMQEKAQHAGIAPANSQALH